MVEQEPLGDAQCPSYAVALGYMGVAAAVCLSNWGSAVSAVVDSDDSDSCLFPMKDPFCGGHGKFEKNPIGRSKCTSACFTEFSIPT